MREIHLNGYIDEDVWFGDEITPGMLHDELYPRELQAPDDVRIILNSYGGSCNAATRMYDELSAYPGNVHVIVSGTAASAATILASAANRLEMTPGSLFMIHDPTMGAYGNAADFQAALDMLRVCKDSILNIYCQRGFHNRAEVAAMMTATPWMDANAAKDFGFIDGLVSAPMDGISNSAFERVVDKEDAKAKVQAWYDRHKPIRRMENTTKASDAPTADTVQITDTVPTEPLRAAEANTPNTAQAAEKNTAEMPILSGTPAAQLEKRLSLLQPYETK